jgi:heterodisulfide reductase subunit D
MIVVGGLPLFVVLFIIATVILLIGVAWNVALWLRGRHSIRGSIGWAVRNLLSGNVLLLFERLVMEVFLQRRLFRQDKLRWLMKVLIIFGYVGIILVNHIKASTRVEQLHGMPEVLVFFFAPFVDYYYLATVSPDNFTGIDASYAMLNELFGGMVILGEFIAIYRRFIARAFPIETTLVDKLAVINLGGWFIFRFLAEAAALQAYRVPDEIARSWFIAYPISKVLPFLGSFNDAMWVLSSLLLASLFASIPFNAKLWHVFMSPFVMLINAFPYDYHGIEGKPAKLDFTARQLIQFDGCVKCQLCTLNCQVYEATKADPELETYLSYAAINSHVKQQLKKGGEVEGDEEVYNCLLCARCAEVCPVFINTRELGIAVRANLYHRGKLPKKFHMAQEAVVKEKNVANFPNSDRAMWVDFFIPEPPEDYYRKEKAEVVYFVGCVASFSPQVQDIPAAMVQLLEKAGVDFTILGEEEHCCGYPLIILGMKEEVEELIRHNIEAIKAKGARTVVFSCPSCYHTFAHEYPEIEGVELMHHSQFIARLIEEGRIKLKRPLNLSVAYHDPCDLGRNSRIFEEPRRVLRSLPGVTFKEFPSNHELALCCGGGGDVEIHNPKITEKVSMQIIHEADETGVDAIATACQQCKRVIKSAAEKHEGKSYQVKDIAELVLEAME